MDLLPLTVHEARAIIAADAALDRTFKERQAAGQTLGSAEGEAWMRIIKSANARVALYENGRKRERPEFVVSSSACLHGRPFSEGGFAFNDPRAHAVAELRSAFADFSRNGRWGTCVSCPCDGFGRKLPELCAFTSREDHQIALDDLALLFKNEVSRFSKERP